MNKRNEGITLIALVITIVVLIILAGVSINLVLGQNGIITKATEARNKTEETKLNEQIAMNEIVEYMNGLGENKPTVPSKPDDWTSTEVTPLPDGEGGVIPLPNGFYYVGGDISTGIVISDNIKDKDKGTAYETVLEGNQFVWIQVESEENMTRTEFDTNGRPIDGLDQNYLEPYSNGYPTEQAEYNTMKTQVLKYGGFYIGRYEAGDGTNGTISRTSATTAHTVVIKKGVVPYNMIPWGVSMNDASEISGQSGAVYLAKNMYKSSSSVVSTLCYGSQWDAMCRYIGDSQRTTPPKGIYAQYTGNLKTDVSKNIYDLAGNCSEYTMESYDYSTGVRVTRGCGYSASLPVNQRIKKNVTYPEYGISFRPTLYIK